MERIDFINAKRIVIKVGTNVLRGDDGQVSLPRIYSFIEDISKLVKAGKEVIFITSGAVGLGKKKMGLDSTAGMALKQACAAIGQSKLMSIYENGFDAYGIVAAQILLTEDDFSIRSRYLSLRITLNKLLDLKVVPVINQNDTVSTIELLATSAESLSLSEKQAISLRSSRVSRSSIVETVSFWLITGTTFRSSSLLSVILRLK